MSVMIFNTYELLLELDQGTGPAPRQLALDHSQGGQPVIIYQVPREIAAAQEFLRLFHGYAKRATMLDHEHIASTIRADVDGDSYYIVERLVYGEPLEALLESLRQRQQRLPLVTALLIAQRIANGLHAAHTLRDGQGRSRGILHGDLIPSKIIISYGGQVEIVGLAVGTASRYVQQTQRGVPALGQLRYTSPEECLGEKPGVASNVYTIGAILWEMLTGAPLHPQADSFELMNAICELPVTAPSRQNKDVPPFVDALVLKALSKESAQRFSDCKQFAQALENVIRRIQQAPKGLQLELLLVELFADRAQLWQSLSAASQSGDRTQIEHLSTKLLRPDLAGSRPRSDLQSTAEMDAMQRQELFDVDDPWSDLAGELSDALSETFSSPEQEPVVRKAVRTPERTMQLSDHDEAILEQTTREIDLDEPDYAATSEPYVAPTQQPRRQPMREAAATVPLNESPFEEELADATREIAAFSSMPTLEPTPAVDWSQQQPPAPAVAPLEPPTPEVRRVEPTERIEHLAEGVSEWRGRLLKEPSATTSTGVQGAGGEDDDDDLFAEAFSLEEMMGDDNLGPDRFTSRDPHEPEPVVEILRLRAGLITEVKTLKGISRSYKPSNSKLVVKRQGKKVTLTGPETGLVGWASPKNAEGKASIPPGQVALELNPGDAAQVEEGGFVYRVKFFYPPLAPAKLPMQQPAKLAVGYVIALGVALVAHVGIGLMFMLIGERVPLTVEAKPPDEIFAEGKLKEPDKPKPNEPEKPKPKPKPKPIKLTQKPPPDPSEAKAKVPKSVRKALDKRLKIGASKVNPKASKADQLTAALASPVQGDGQTIKDVVTNLDAVKPKDGASGAFRVAGTIASIEGDAPNIGRGGGGKIGDLSKGVAGGVGKLEKREGASSGKIRGKVRAVTALAKVQGSISRGEVMAEINKHIGKIQMCYERQLNKNPKLAGKVNFEWTIKSNGGVSGAKEKSSTLNDATVSNCIKNVIVKMKFPKPKGGDVIIVFPFIFNSAS